MALSTEALYLLLVFHRPPHEKGVAASHHAQ
jgi:hypothetical protein